MRVDQLRLDGAGQIHLEISISERQDTHVGSDAVIGELDFDTALEIGFKFALSRFLYRVTFRVLVIDVRYQLNAGSHAWVVSFHSFFLNKSRGNQFPKKFKGMHS